MGFCVCSGATLSCPFGALPSTMVVTPENSVLGSTPLATIDNNKPFVNIMPFGMCSSQSNPQVAAATSAAMGVLTPMPCLPVITEPWAPGSPGVLIKGKPALNQTSKLRCNWGGMIQIVNPGVQNIQIP